MTVIRVSPAREDIGSHLDVLDGIRVIFVFMVAWFHIWQQSWLSPVFHVLGKTISLDFLPRASYVFVDGMLLLSALVLYYKCAEGKFQSVLTFYKRRLARILPSYLLCIVIMLLCYALPKGLYRTPGAAVRDVLAHLTFTHMFSPGTYISTPLNAALWTVAVEMQFYLLFPLLSRAYFKAPAVTFLSMCVAAFLYRGWALTLPDTAMVLNQFPAFLDVFAVGFLSASVIRKFQKRKGLSHPEKVFFTAVMGMGICLLVMLLRSQASENGYDAIRAGQMIRRFPLCLVLALIMISACFSVPAVRFLLGNKVMAFLAGISYNFYIWHQVFAVRIKEWGVIPAKNVSPWQMGERAWQIPYTLVCFAGALIIAALVTYLVEKPAARRINGGKQ